MQGKCVSYSSSSVFGILLCMCFLAGCETTHKANLLIKVNEQPDVTRKDMKTGETLTLVCEVKLSLNNSANDFKVTWTVPSENRHGRLFHDKGNGARLSITLIDLRKTDSGNYTCHARSSDYTNSTVFILNVVSSCGAKFFACNDTHCIPNRYVCDGRADCLNGEDEAFERCGANVCDGKMPCDGRCVDKSVCCPYLNEHNCTYKYSPQCCQFNLNSPQSRETPAGILFQKQNINSRDRAHTIIASCVVGLLCVIFVALFIFRYLELTNRIMNWCFPHCDAQCNRPPIMNCYPEFNPRDERTRMTNEFQMISPPPYSEIVQMPPDEDPPPPYESRENLAEGSYLLMMEGDGATGGTVANNNEDINGNSAPDLEEARQKSSD